MKKTASKLPRIALTLAILLIVWFLAASLGARFGLWSPLTGFLTMTMQWGSIFTLLVAVMALVALVLAIIRKSRRGIIASLLALLVPALVGVGVMLMKKQSESVPFIYDIATDTASAPTYSDKMMELREQDDANPLIEFQVPLDSQEKWRGNEAVAGKTAAELIAEGYPQLTTLAFEASPEDVMSASQAAMETRGFHNIMSDRKTGRVEGTDVLFWYGFHDDVVILVRKHGEGSVVDFRSTSRVGTSDLGVNAKRIMDLQQAVTDRLSPGGEEGGR